MARIFTTLLLAVLGFLLIVFLISNRQLVPLSMDPTSQENPALATPPLPLAVHLVIALAFGFVLGALGMYLSGGKKRRALREKSREVRRLREELKEARAAGLPVLREGDVDRQPAPSDAARLPAPAAS